MGDSQDGGKGVSVSDQRGYRVLLVGDDELQPAELSWAFVECSGETMFLLKESRVTEVVLEDAWQTFRETVDA